MNDVGELSSLRFMSGQIHVSCFNTINRKTMQGNKQDFSPNKLFNLSPSYTFIILARKEVSPFK